MRRALRSCTSLLILAAAVCPAQQQKRKRGEDDLVLPPVLEAMVDGKKRKNEPVTQTLETLPDPPAYVLADKRKLVFHVAPMSAKGLLSQQVRVGIKTLWRLNG
ncbi:MAG: hypothetical protein ACRD44_11090, partial [Bryobacteraceae bacterium]